MKKNSVPQDKVRTYSGHKKLMYATDNDGNYDSIQSSGWEIEEHATITAVDEFNRLAAEALKQAHAGECSPLMYHMYAKRMDPELLSQVTGLFQWRIKRHLKNNNFEQLKPSILNRYAEAMGISVNTLTQLPEIDS